MTPAEQTFHQIGTDLDGTTSGKLFGKPCFKVGKKAFVCFFQDEMVFKLTEESHHEALSLAGAKLFDPSGKGRPMKEWVQLPYEYQEHWGRFAQAALAYVSGLK